MALTTDDPPIDITERPVPNEPVDVPFPDPPVRNGRPLQGARDGRPPPADLDAERALLGAQLLAADARNVASSLSSEAYLKPAHGALHHTIQKLHTDGQPIDAVTVADALATHEIDSLGGRSGLLTLIADTPSTSNAAAYTRIIETHWLRRQRLSSIAKAVDSLYGCDDAGVDTALQAAVDTTTRTHAAGLPAVAVDSFLAGDEEDFDWVIEGVLERTDRVLVTGPEGGGKSTLLRQIAVQVAAGIHPFTLDEAEPRNVLLLDLENSRRHVRRQLRPLRISAGGRLNPDHLHVTSHAEGLDLLDPTDRSGLERLIADVQPDLVVGGPVYKLVGGDPTEEQPAKAAATLLDKLRIRHGFALVLETHQPHEASGSKRPERPYGASLWKRWPEFGLHIGADPSGTGTSELRHWRGARDERDWPSALKRGGDWPWTVAANKDITFARVLAVGRDHVARTGDLPSLREVEKVLVAQGLTGVSKSNVERAIKSNKSTWNALIEEAL